MAGLGDRAALHIHRHRLREVFQDRAHLLLAVYKPFAAHNLSGVDLRVPIARQVIDGECLLHIFLRCFEGSRHAQNLSGFAFLAAVGIVVNAVGSHYHLSHVEVDISASSHARRDNKVWVIVVNHFHGTYGTVHLTDAALLHHHLVIAYLSDNEVLIVFSLNLRFGQ